MIRLTIIVFVFMTLDCSSVLSSEKKHIWIPDYGWHTGIILPYVDFSKDFFTKEFADVSYLEFGWGDKDYYPEPNPSLFVGLKALFWPSASVLHVVGYNTHPENIFRKDEITVLEVNAKSYLKIISYIKNTFVLGKNKKPVLFSKGLYLNKSYFYKAKGDFHLFNTCNTWSEKITSLSK
jgi:uncharacterized protein (TIGR02117 family)